MCSCCILSEFSQALNRDQVQRSGSANNSYITTLKRQMFVPAKRRLVDKA